jgi:hypothetical protein
MAFQVLLTYNVATATHDEGLMDRLMRWLSQDMRQLFLDKESVMGQLILFHVPTHFRPPAKQWTPPELRGKVLAFVRRPRNVRLTQPAGSSRRSDNRETRLS